MNFTIFNFCQYHDEHDCSLFCALTNVTKWSHIFTDNICVDLGIDPENREHFPSEIDTANTSTNTFPAAAETQVCIQISNLHTKLNAII